MSEPKPKQVELRAGTVRYRESGSGPPVLFVHGFLVDGRLWDGVAAELSRSHRCILPDWPFGAHRLPMGPDADLSPHGVADLIAELVRTLELENLTVVGNDSGGAMSQIFATRHPELLARLVLTNCDTHENFPPGPFKALVGLARIPGAMRALGLPLRIGPLARATFRPFTKRPISPDLIASWVEPSQADAAIRRDTIKFMAEMSNRFTIEAAEKLAGSDLPLLLTWASEDWLFKPEYARRLAAETRNSRLVEIPDARTFVPLDQPARVAEEIAAFAA